MYCNEQGFAQRFGEKELSELLPEGAHDEGRLYRAAASDADSLIDGYICARYTVPLTTVPALIVGIAADITRHELWHGKGTEEIEERHTAAIKLLTQIRDGEISLPGATPVPSDSGGIAVSAACRVFTKCVTDDFVGRL